MPDACEEAIEKRFGLDQAVIDRINGVLAGFPSIEKAVLYGSRAKGNHRPGSDIDLAIVGTGVTEEELLEMDNRLDDLLLPYTIDLCRFHGIRNPDLIGHIDRVGVIFFPDCKAR
uniref:Predicted nucleotidyltransferase n=1 Tax=Candidatus Kentrum sp. DK TaxID=2126562 RepID=A0A450RVT7_9GAMM|nr:MAG: Predicted nucleotidyltransferase [Candidatus Kentron sp. DK]VFJ56085.1 MAG: Predicted nucleotidyltransferase [Candidatus Kentron sp. DK]